MAVMGQIRGGTVGGGAIGQVLFDEQWTKSWSSSLATLSKTCQISGHIWIEYVVWASSYVTITKNGTTQTPTFERNSGSYYIRRWDFDVSEGDEIVRTFSSTGSAVCVGIGVIVNGTVIPYE